MAVMNMNGKQQENRHVVVPSTIMNGKRYVYHPLSSVQSD